MDADKSSELVRSFVEDHKVLMRGLADIREKLQKQNYTAAKEMADDLDQSVGSHIRFEEEFLYPAVAKTFGAEFESELREEHMVVSKALKKLLELDATGIRAARNELEAALETAIEHAGSCGTLASHLHRLPATEKQKALESLTKFREDRVRWTEQDKPERAP